MKRYVPSRLVTQLRMLRSACKHQEDLASECAVITALIAAVRFSDAFNVGPRQDWSNLLGVFNTEIKNVQKALDIEFPDAKAMNGRRGLPVEAGSEQ